MKKFTLLFFISMIMGISLSVNAQESEADEGIKPALLVIDVQNIYLPMMDQEAVDKPIDMVNASVWLFNQLKLPVIYVYHQDKEQGPATDSKEFEFTDKIPLPENATKVIKHYGNAFNKTELDKILKDLGCNSLFLCGLSATGCVMATYVGANDLDYDVFVIKDALMSADNDKTKMMEDVMESMRLQSMYFFLPNIK